MASLDKWFNWCDLEPQMQIGQGLMRLCDCDECWMARQRFSMRVRVRPSNLRLFIYAVRSKGDIYINLLCFASWKSRARCACHCVSLRVHAKCVVCAISNARKTSAFLLLLLLFCRLHGRCFDCRFPFNDMMNFIFTCRKLWQFLIYLFQSIFSFIFSVYFFLRSIGFALVQTHFFPSSAKKNQIVRIATEPDSLVHAPRSCCPSSFEFSLVVLFCIFFLDVFRLFASDRFRLVIIDRKIINRYMWHALCCAIAAWNVAAIDYMLKYFYSFLFFILRNIWIYAPTDIHSNVCAI